MINFKRGKKQYPNSFTIKELYNFYKEDAKKPVSLKVYRKVLYEFHEDIINRIIFKGETIRFFSNLGLIRIRRRKKKIRITEDGKVNRSTMSVDWLRTKQMWSNKYPDLTKEQILEIPVEKRGFVYNTNEHTNRYTFKFYWDKMTVKLPNKSYYSFDALREPANRKLAKALKSDKQLQYIYFE